jgi:hypothetical protein
MQGKGPEIDPVPGGIPKVPELLALARVHPNSIISPNNPNVLVSKVCDLGSSSSCAALDRVQRQRSRLCTGKIFILNLSARVRGAESSRCSDVVPSVPEFVTLWLT